MCALVSELCVAGTHDERVERWAQRTVHWRDCVAAEREARVLDGLRPYVEGVCGCPMSTILECNMLK